MRINATERDGVLEISLRWAGRKLCSASSAAAAPGRADTAKHFPAMRQGRRRRTCGGLRARHACSGGPSSVGADTPNRLCVRTPMTMPANRVCSACRTTIRHVLAQHHIVPRALDGTDAPTNLTTVCANCHRLVRWLAVGWRDVSREWTMIRAMLAKTTADHLASLAEHTRARRDRVVASENRWIAEAAAKGAVSLDDAIAALLRRNGYAGAEARALERATRRPVQRTPPTVLARSSVRLLGDGRYLSVNAGNHLLFRVPAYSDAGKRQFADTFIIWPTTTGVSADFA